MVSQDAMGQSTGLEADRDKLVRETHEASLKLREQPLRKTIARDTCWPRGIWGDNLWCLAALSLNEKVAATNARLLTQANDHIQSYTAAHQDLWKRGLSPDDPGSYHVWLKQ
jgi:hypothetical protein